MRRPIVLAEVVFMNGQAWFSVPAKEIVGDQRILRRINQLDLAVGFDGVYQYLIPKLEDGKLQSLTIRASLGPEEVPIIVKKENRKLKL